MSSQAAPAEVPDEAKEAQLEVVRDVGGRPLFLTPRRFIRICRWIEQGESASEACRLELVTYPGQTPPNSGIYRCMGCGREIVAEKDRSFPPQNHHQHKSPAQGHVRWRLIVFADHTEKH